MFTKAIIVIEYYVDLQIDLICFVYIVIMQYRENLTCLLHHWLGLQCGMQIKLQMYWNIFLLQNYFFTKDMMFSPSVVFMVCNGSTPRGDVEIPPPPL